MSIRSALRLLQKNYPTIYNELNQKPSLTNLDNINQLLNLFCNLKGLTFEEVIKNRDQSRILFITIIVKCYDPIFFIDEEKVLKRHLREELSNVLFCHETQISHILSTARTYLKVYKQFREEVDWICEKLINEVTCNNALKI